MVAEAAEVLAFWIDETGAAGWYAVDEGLDAQIRARFLSTWRQAGEGALDPWRADPRSCLALIIVLDQFPRNMFRADPRAFSTDAKALEVAKAALGRGFDLRIEPPARQFFYLPMMHSEIVSDQERSVRMFKLNGAGGDNLTHARAHRAVIRRFGRFPYRNAALGRATTPAEAEWMERGGYEAALAEVRAPLDGTGETA